jgi:EAL domain-containing protein (putative c-di-GMP-specific phosphodiesterase class I)
VSEGIETAEQKNLLSEYDENIIGQGYLLARPLDVDSFAALLHSNSNLSLVKRL